MKKNSNIDSSDKIQSFLVSLHYLSKEAERENLPKIQKIMVDAINNIQKWLDGKDPSSKIKILDSSIYDAIEFLNRFASLPDSSQKALASLFEKVDEDKIAEIYINKQREVH